MQYKFTLLIFVTKVFNVCVDIINIADINISELYI